MGIGLMCAGFILLFNPVINVFDVIPDALGFLLIFAGLTRMSHFFEKTEKARRFFMWLAVVECAKIASIGLVVTSSTYESGSLKVMLSLVFLVVELILFIPAVIWMFDGMTEAAVKLGTEKSNLIVKNNGKEYDISVSTRNYMIFFMILRCAATLIPELTELEMYDRLGNVSAFSRPLTYYKPILYIFFAVIVIVFGIIYIVKTVRYFNFLMTDKKFTGSFDLMYKTAKKERKSYFLAYRVRSSLILYAASVIGLFPFYLDNVNILIGVLSAGLLVAATLVMSKHAEKTNIVIPFAVLEGVAAVISFILQIRYFDNYSVEAIEWVEKAEAQYGTMALFGVIENVFAAFAVVSFTVIFLKAVKNHLRICGICEETAQYSKEVHDREKYAQIRTRFILSAIFLVMLCVSKSVYRYVELDFQVYILINAVIAILAVGYTVYAVASTNTLVYDKETAR